MPTITVPIIAQSTATPPVFYGMIGTLAIVLNNDNSFASGTVLFTKPQALVALGSLTTSQVGTTPVIQNGALQFQLAGAASTYPPTGPPKSKPPFTFTGQIDVSQLQITGQVAWLPQGLLTALAATSTSASGNFTQSPATFSNLSVLSLTQWQSPLYSSTLLATGLQAATNCDLQITLPQSVPSDLTLYLNLEGGTTSAQLDLIMFPGSNPTVFATLPSAASNAFAWYSWVIPQALLAAGANALRIANVGQTSPNTTVYIKNVAVVW